MQQFNKKAYAEFIATDPVRAMHYDRVEDELDLHSHAVRHILDVGCGSGGAPRRFAAQGVHITGFDSAQKLIAEARAEEKKFPLGIDYMHVSAKNFRPDRPSDVAYSVMVLPYAKGMKGLHEFFRAAYAGLLPGAAFHSVVLHPELQPSTENCANRRFLREGERGIQVDFLSPKTMHKAFESHLTQFTANEYETAANDEGFGQAVWSDVLPDARRTKAWGSAFWQKLVERKPYALLSVTKPIQ